MFDLGAAARADVIFEANVGGFRADVRQIRAEAERTYGALSADTLKAALASDKYDRALARSKGETFAVRKATATYRQEMAALDGTTRRTSGALAAEERNLSRLARGAVFGSGALGGLRRAAVFASSSFLGGFGLTYAIRSFVKAAQDEGVALARVEQSLTNAGHDADAYKGRVDAALTSLVRFSGFNRDELANSLAANITRFGDYETAVRATADAADVARQKGEDLATAQQQIQRASFGNPRALKQLGIELPKTTANMDALRAVTKNATAEQVAQAKAADLQANETVALAAVEARYHGSAAKSLTTSAGKQALFNAEVRQTKAIIGEALLPTLNRYLERGAKWLDQMSRSGKLQHDVQVAAHDVGVAFHTLFLILAPLATGFRLVGKAVGGTKHEIELLTAVAVGLSARKALIRGGILGIGSAAATAEGKVGGLRTGLLGLGSPEVLLALAAVYDALLLINDETTHHTKGHAQTGGPAKLNTEVFEQRGHYYQRITVGRSVVTKEITKREAEKILQKSPAGRTGSQSTNQARNEHLREVHNGPPGSGSHSPPKAKPLVVGLNYRQQNELLEAQATKGPGDDLRVLNRQLGVLNRALTQNGLTPAQRNQLLSSRNDVLGQIDSITSASAQLQKEQARRAKETAAKARKKRIDSLTKAPVELRIAEKTAEAHSASEQKIVAILRREKKAIEEQIVELRKIGAGKEAIARARANEAAIQKKIDAKKGGGAAGSIFDEAANEFKLYGSNIAGRGEPLSGQDARGLLGMILLEMRHTRRAGQATAGHTKTIAKSRRTQLDDARAAAGHGY